MILTDAAASFSLISWGMDNTIVYGTIGKGIMRVSANGGTPEAIVKAENEMIAAHPQLLPDGKSVLFASLSPLSPSNSKVLVQSLKSRIRGCERLRFENAKL